MVAPRELGGEPRAILEEARPEPVKMGTADLQVMGRILGVNFTLIELPEDLLDKQVGQALGDLLLLIAPSQPNCRTVGEGFRRPSLRSGRLNPSPTVLSPTQTTCLLLNSLVSPFVPAPTANSGPGTPSCS